MKRATLASKIEMLAAGQPDLRRVTISLTARSARALARDLRKIDQYFNQPDDYDAADVRGEL